MVPAGNGRNQGKGNGGRKKIELCANMNGRFLKSGRSRQLCFITSSISGEYFYRLTDSMNAECEKNGYCLNIVVTRDKNTMMNNVLGGRFDGFFLFEGERIAAEELERLEKEHIVAIMLDRKYVKKTIGSVVFDSYQAGYEITKHLINLGHKRIGFLDSASDIYDCSERKRGYQKAWRSMESLYWRRIFFRVFLMKIFLIPRLLPRRICIIGIADRICGRQ